MARQSENAARRESGTNGPPARVFVDTWGLRALADKRDADHQAAHTCFRQLHVQRRPLVSTDWVLAEFLAGMAKPPARGLAIQFVDNLPSKPRLSVLPATHNDWVEGYRLYRSRPDKSWSLVDCISILVCKRLGITEVFTGDHHFAQAGLTVLLPPTE